MVQVIEDKYSGNIFGRIGAGLGKGLSEQLPKEIERGRLSAGLRKFEKERANLSPVEQFTRLAGIPGFTAEHLYTLAPLLQQEAKRREGQQGFGPGGNLPQGQIPQQGMTTTPTGQPKSAKNEKYPAQENLALETPSLKPKSYTEAQVTPIVKKSDIELMPRAQQLAAERPYQFPNGAIDALPLARQEDDTRIANLQEERNIGEAADIIEKRVKGELRTQWGKDATVTEGALDSNIPGTIQSNLERQMLADLNDPKNRLSESQLVTKYAEIGKDIARAKTILDGRAASTLLSLDYSPEKIRTTIEETRPAYEKAGGLKEYRDIIANKFNLSSQGASAFAYPPENKNINSIFKNIQKPIQNEFGAYYPGKDPTSLAIAAADKVSPLITDEDSLLTYALEAQKKGLDENAFLRRLRQNRNAGIFNANQRQVEEFSTGLAFWPALGDFWTDVKNLYKGKK